ncbi:hypothetical protein BJV82DRAFT_574914 [Fennellomyces sp. T-0311]|nr:hypothetical protein BJV82DRAFT_574914 [Fennellomyces sp. T-0311]
MFKFDFKTTPAQADVLTRIYRCTSMEELESIRAELFAMQDSNGGIDYLRSAINQVIRLWRSNKLLLHQNEDWWRVNVYSQLFDSVYLDTAEYNCRRSELLPQVMRELNLVNKEIVKHKSDLIVSGVSNGDDVLIGEDKTTMTSAKAMKEALEKNTIVRVQTLDAIQKKLPDPTLINYFDAISVLWVGNELLITTTKRINGIDIHFESGRASFSLTSGNFEELARMLMMIISLKDYTLRSSLLLQKLRRKIFRLSLANGGRSPIRI